MIFVDCQEMINIQYSLHHDFSDAVKVLENITDCVEQRNNPFKKDDCKIIKNFVKGTIINQDAADLLVFSTKYGRKAYESFKNKHQPNPRVHRNKIEDV